MKHARLRPALVLLLAKDDVTRRLRYSRALIIRSTRFAAKDEHPPTPPRTGVVGDLTASSRTPEERGVFQTGTSGLGFAHDHEEAQREELSIDAARVDPDGLSRRAQSGDLPHVRVLGGRVSDSATKFALDYYEACVGLS